MHSILKHGRCRTASTSFPAPQAPQALQQAVQQIQHMPQLNWSHFKPEFSGKPEEDAEAHLLRTNDWMDMHQIQEGVKVQRFCLTLVEEARLWYEFLRPINVDWLGLKNQFRQQYSKIENTREQLFHVAIIPFQWKHRNLRFICDMQQASSYTFRL